MTNTNRFEALGLSDSIMRALRAKNYTAPTPIQAQAIPALLAGKDLLGIAQTGTGKTAAFALPLLHLLSTTPGVDGPKQARALILAPTRELVMQITDSFKQYGRHLRLTQAALVGGLGYGAQIKSLAKGVDILIATPGRLIDLMKQGHVLLNGTSIFVLDEADRMLDMGFIHDVRRIMAVLPKQRHSLLFSATMPNDIADLARQILRNPVRVDITPEVITVERIDQRVFHVDGKAKRGLLMHLLQDPALNRVIVFTRTKHGANRVSEYLEKGGIAADAIHGNKSQGARQRALKNFRDGRSRVLVATDIAARGIDVPNVSHVINFELPNVPESYVHRIGRTARAGQEGIAFSFCDGTERSYLRGIERLAKKPLKVVKMDADLLKIIAQAQAEKDRSADHNNSREMLAPSSSNHPIPGRSDQFPRRSFRGKGKGASSRSSNRSHSRNDRRQRAKS